MESSSKRQILVESLVLVVWLIIMALLHSWFMRPDVFMISIVFGIVGFAASVAGLLVIDGQRTRSRALADANLLASFVPALYFGAALIVNTLFCVMSYVWISTKGPIIVNLLLLLVAAVVLIGMNSYTQRAEKDVARAGAAVGQHAIMAAHVATLLSQAQDGEVRKELLKLKQLVDFSSSVSQSSTADVETKFLSQLGAIESALESGVAPAEVIELVRQAELTWKKRNAINSSIH